MSLLTRYQDFITHKKLKRRLLNNKVGLFTNIEIETFNVCNGTCVFCPVNRNADTRKKHLMSDFVFEKIIGELCELQYNGTIGLYSNNEPMLDRHIELKIIYARESLPEAKLYIYTNGTLLTLPIFICLIRHLDKMIIDCFDDRLEIPPHLEEIIQYMINQAIHKKVIVYKFKRNEKLSNRAGQALNRTSLKRPLKSMCVAPFEQIVVRSKGQVSLCCNDALGCNTLGNVCEESLTDIWKGAQFTKVRNKLIQNSRTNIPSVLCAIQLL